MDKKQIDRTALIITISIVALFLYTCNSCKSGKNESTSVETVAVKKVAVKTVKAAAKRASARK